MARQRFTAGRVRDFKCPKDKKQAFFWDSETPGLGIRATKTAKVYVFQGRLNKKTIRVKIGPVQSYTIEDIRKEGQRIQGLFSNGIDPRIDKQERIAEQDAKRNAIQRKGVTLTDVWPIYIEDRKPKWSDRHLLDHIRIAHPGGKKLKRGKGKTKPGALAALMNYKLSELTPDNIKIWLEDEKEKRSTQARIAFDALRAFINWAEDYKDKKTKQKKYQGLASLDACSRKIKTDILPKKKAKEDCLQKEQLSVWFEAVKHLSNPIISAYLQGLLLTGARREELASLKWDDADFRWQSITIHDKVDDLRTIPLTPYFASLIAMLPRRNQWVFSSPRAASGRLQEPRIPHNRALEVAGIPNLTLHGLRRSFSTLSEWEEVPVGIVAQIMGHKPSATSEKYYKKRPLDLLRMWHVKIEKWILEQAGIEQPESVQSDSNFKVVGEN